MKSDYSPVSVIAGFATGTLFANHMNTDFTVIPLWMMLIIGGLLTLLFDYMDSKQIQCEKCMNAKEEAA